MSIKSKKHKDPYRDREAKKYEHPIFSREYLLQFIAEQEALLSFSDLADALGLADKRDRDALRRRLRAMARDGQIMRNRRGGYGVVDKMDLQVGRVSGHSDGFGFLIPEDGGEDMFLSPRQMRGVMHGDRVLVRLAGRDRRGRMEAEIVEVLERHTEQVVGRFFIESGIGFVEPSDMRLQSIVIPESEQAGASSGQIVTVEVKDQPTLQAPPVGRVVEILGDQMAPGMEIEIAIRNYKLPHQWPERVENEANKIGDTVPEKIAKQRTDLRHLPLVTIDGEDAKDFDDAVYCEKQDKNWRLIVAIADVSTYVKPNSALDQEAVVRGNSVYFPNRVIPMLPESLSNGLCSLNPDVDRLCLVCDMIISSGGDTEKYQFYPAVIKSHGRLTYNKVAAVFDGDKQTNEELQSLVPLLQDFHKLYRVCLKQRKKRGAIDFDTVETRIVFGEQKKIEQIVPVIRNDAHRLIEEFMIKANVCAAKYLLKNKMPGLYRVHEGPPADQLADLRQFLGEFGLKLGGGDKPEAKHYAQVLRQVQGQQHARLIQTVMLRSMSQAIYSNENIGHFGLAFAAYTHFTSPIRRYPDLIVHRAIYHLLSGEAKEKFVYTEQDLQQIGIQCSTTERRADEATRDAVSWLKCEFMLDKVGMRYDGIIVGVTGFGIFVELDDIFVEGLVHVTALTNDYYHFDPVRHTLSGERTGRQYRLGDKIQVTVARVDLDDRKVDFILQDEAATLKKSKGGRRKTGKRRNKKKRG